MTHDGGIARVSFEAIGTTATVLISGPEHLHTAERILRDELEGIDRAASRFRADSELCALNACAGRPFVASPLLFSAITEAVRAARITDGLVDPTVGQALLLAGYDRDFSQIEPTSRPLTVLAAAVPGWRAIHRDPATRTIRLPAGVTLDLGATAKAMCADLTATRIAHSTGAGVLVSLGGDIAVAGPPPDSGWSVRVTDNHADPPVGAFGPAVSIRSGGVATSSTSIRRWLRGGRWMHHLINPATGLPAAEYWRTASVAAGTCLDANIASCAAILLGSSAPGWLAERGLPARLVEPSGRVTHVSNWPAAGEPDRVEEPVTC